MTDSPTLWVKYQDDEPMALVRERLASPAEILSAARPHLDYEAAAKVLADNDGIEILQWHEELSRAVLIAALRDTDE